MLIHICGIDGSGKTTLAQRLKQVYKHSIFLELSANTKLVNQVNELCMEINSTRWEKFDNYFRSILWANELFNINLSSTKDDKLIFVDRYKLCNLVYSQLEDNSSLENIKKIHKVIPDPDYLIFLDTPIDLAQERIRKRGEEQSPKESLTNMKTADTLYRNYLETMGDNVFYIDGSITKTEVLDKAVNIINQLNIGG